MRLLGHPDFRSMFVDEGMGRRSQENDSSDSDQGDGSTTPKRRRPRGKDAFEKVPSDVGTALMRSGEFGYQPCRRESMKWKKKMAYKAMMRELGLGTPCQQRSHNSRIAQVKVFNATIKDLLTYQGTYTIIQSRYDNTPRIEMLLWSIF